MTTLQEIEIKEEKRKYTVPQGGKKNNQGENNKQKGEREVRKMQRGGDRNRTSSKNSRTVKD